MIHTRVSFTDRLRREQKAVFNQGVVETVHLPVHVGFNVTVALIEIGAFLSVAGCSVLFSDSLCFWNVGLKEMFLVMLCRLDLKWSRKPVFKFISLPLRSKLERHSGAPPSVFAAANQKRRYDVKRWGDKEGPALYLYNTIFYIYTFRNKTKTNWQIKTQFKTINRGLVVTLFALA